MKMNFALIATLSFAASIGFAANQDPKLECPSTLTVKISKIQDGPDSSYGKGSDYADLTNVLSESKTLNLKSDKSVSTFLELGGCGFDNATSTAKATVAANINKLGVITVWLPIEQGVVEGSFDYTPSAHFARIYSTPFDKRARVGSAQADCFHGQYECANPFSHNSDGQDWLNISSFEITAKYASKHAPIVIKSN